MSATVNSCSVMPTDVCMSSPVSALSILAFPGRRMNVLVSRLEDDSLWIE